MITHINAITFFLCILNGSKQHLLIFHLCQSPLCLLVLNRWCANLFDMIVCNGHISSFMINPNGLYPHVVGENGHAFFNCDLHGVLKFSQVVGVVPWYLLLQFGRGAEVSPRWNLWGVAFPPGITNMFKKSHL